MKLNYKLLALLLALILAFSTFVGCSPASTADETTAPTESANVTEAPETEPIPEGPTVLNLISGGQANVKIVRPSNLKTDDMPVKIAIEIRKVINNITGVNPELGDDWVKKGESHDSSTLEILIGATAYPETAEATKDMSYGEYTIQVVGNKIVVFSFTDSGYTRAMNEMITLLKNSVTDEADGTKTLTLSADQLNILKKSDAMTASLPVYEGGTFSSVTDMGDGCYGVIIEDTNTEEYNKYLEKLTAAGYQEYAENEIVGSLFCTLYTEKYTVNAGYYNNMSEVRIIIEPFAEDTLPTKKSDAAPVTTSQISMIGVEGIYSGEYQQNGMCIIYRLSDGSFVIVDGGHHGNSAIYAANIIKALREQSKDYAKTDKDITIAAWIISHPHTDHFGTLMNEYKQFTKFNFERIMVNFWPEAAFDVAQKTTSSFATGQYKNYNKTVSVAKEIGVDYVVPHVGQVWWFGDTSFEILYTIESYLPKVATGFNTSSIVFRSTTMDASGKSTTAIITGDATGHALAVCNKMYKNNLKCDIVQVAHHGGGTGGANNDTKSAYALMKPSVILWPVGQNHYSTVAANTYNHALLADQNPNYAELYVAGWQGNTVTIPLPYTLGTAITNNIVEPKK
jgi:hypothetical protein